MNRKSRPKKNTPGPLPGAALFSERALHILYPALIVIGFLIVYINIFNSRVSLEDDNAAYFLLGKGMISGYGYSSFNDASHAPANNFPPGYPTIIAGILLLFPDSILAVTIMNGVFLTLALLLFFDFFRRIGANIHLNFLSCLFIFLTTGITRVENQGLSINASLLTSSTSMMSETPYLFFVGLTLCFFQRLDTIIQRAGQAGFSLPALLAPFRQPYFYLALFGLTATFHIRTAGVSLAGFILLYWLFYRRWNYVIATGVAYALLALPWFLRGRALGGSPYISQLLSVNPYRLELGQAGPWDLAVRFMNNMQRYITKEIPVGAQPMTITYETTTAGDWILGLVVIGVAFVGLWKLNRVLLGCYFIALFSIVLMWPDVWIGARFLLPGVPFLIVCLTHGAQDILSRLAGRMRLPFGFHPLFLCVCLLFYKPNLDIVARAAKAPYPPEWRAYVDLAVWARANTDTDVIIACRKPYLFALFSNRYTMFYPNTADDRDMLKQLSESRVTHVVLDQLGFSSTGLYLYPAIQKHPDRFIPIHQVKNPHNDYLQYLLHFVPDSAVPDSTATPPQGGS
jgi:hypothetical protein